MGFKKLLCSAVIAGMLMVIGEGAFAQDKEMTPGYLEANFRNLSRASMYMNYEYIYKDKAVDQYAEIFYCDLYREKFKNDFEWRKIRDNIRKEINEQRNDVHRFYEFNSILKLDRYDFERQVFPLAERSILDNVGSMYINAPKGNEIEPYCDRLVEQAYFFPSRRLIALSTPITINEIHIEAQDAERVLNYIEREDGDERIVYARFRAKINTASPVMGEGIGIRILYSGKIENVTFYVDRKRTIEIGRMTF